jgi:hypothetical protein
MSPSVGVDMSKEKAHYWWMIFQSVVVIEGLCTR